MYPVMNSASKVNGILFCLVLAGMFVYSLPPVFSFAKNQGDAWTLFPTPGEFPYEGIDPVWGAYVRIALPGSASPVA